LCDEIKRDEMAWICGRLGKMNNAYKSFNWERDYLGDQDLERGNDYN
jgi:hypothetical protein